MTTMRISDGSSIDRKRRRSSTFVNLPLVLQPGFGLAQPHLAGRLAHVEADQREDVGIRRRVIAVDADFGDRLGGLCLNRGNREGHDQHECRNRRDLHGGGVEISGSKVLHYRTPTVTVGSR